MAPTLTVSAFREAAEVTNDDINAAIDAALTELATAAYPTEKGWTLDLVDTPRTNTAAAEALKTDKAP